VKGTVRRRESGDYEYRFDAGFDPLTGQRRRPGRSGFKTKREAEQALRAAITAHEKGRSVRSSARTVGEFLEESAHSDQGLRPSLDVGELPQLHASLRHSAYRGDAAA
jgi:Arm DNA-binding domain